MHPGACSFPALRVVEVRAEGSGTQLDTWSGVSFPHEGSQKELTVNDSGSRLGLRIDK